MPSRCSMSETSRCSGSICAWLDCSASCCAPITASCAFSVYLFRFMTGLQLLQRFEMRALLRRQFPGELLRRRWHTRSPISSFFSLPAAGIPCPRRRKTCPFCVVGGIFNRRGFPPSVVTSASPPRTAVVSGHGHARIEVAALALEPAVRREPDSQIQIAGLAAADSWLALAGDSDARSITHTGGNPAR